MHSSIFPALSISLLWVSFGLALPFAPGDVSTIKSSRSIDTCADPSITQTVFQAFGASITEHVLNYRHFFENGITRGSAGLTDLEPAFRAWPTQQNFTVPLFQLGTPDRTQFIYRTGTDAQTPPVVSGFNTQVALLGWVYDSQVCGSVPLMSAVLPSFTDHYYTTNSFEHDSLVSSDGWTDGGVVAFVLPLYNC
ncbi:hypothetical protein D9619_007558 [Psilocybe cf. subviscida]|uniref:DUF5648 domain-containing protein n=1 Tax=Psilocybe cf. subviscida TaxID=2480587 RepID=A0A8H5EWV3_9AGAR|nr:hypothetical protein D9619_007558 [Psilocybe cf. subviscida]